MNAISAFSPSQRRKRCALVHIVTTSRLILVTFPRKKWIFICLACVVIAVAYTRLNNIILALQNIYRKTRRKNLVTFSPKSLRARQVKSGSYAQWFTAYLWEEVTMRSTKYLVSGIGGKRHFKLIQLINVFNCGRSYIDGHNIFGILNFQAKGLE